MTAASFAGFALLYAIAVASPGPGVAAIVARGLATGTRGAAAFVAGFTMGDLVWFTASTAGLAAVARAADALFTLLRYAGALYLLWLAVNLWRMPVGPQGTLRSASGDDGWRAFLAGVTLTLGNPKSMVFYLAVLPAFLPPATLELTSVVAISCIILTLNPLILGAYAVAAARARHLFRNAVALRRLYRLLAALLAVAALLVVLRAPR